MTKAKSPRVSSTMTVRCSKCGAVVHVGKPEEGRRAFHDHRCMK